MANDSAMIVRPIRLGLSVALLAGGLAGVVVKNGAHASGPFDGCQSSGAPITIDQVDCQTMPSADLGGTTAFSYYVPPDCATTKCPALYLLHGFGGDLTSMIGTKDHPSAWVESLTKQPSISPYDTATPWTEADPSTWVPANPLDVVLIAPDGRTVQGGDGPLPGLEGFWTDWNPRYAQRGDSQRYDTPPPRFAASVTDELIPYVESHFNVAAGRTNRAIAGTSLGGYGSYAIGLTHPDMFASVGAVSGIMNILLLPGLNPSPSGGPGGVAPPVALPYAALPGVAGGSVPLAALPSQVQGFAVATYAFGDPAADQEYFRGRQPRDLALNGHAVARGNKQSVLLRDFSNDTIPRQASDFSSPPGYLGAQAFEDLVLPSNVEMNQAFADAGVVNHYELHPGIHSDVYWNPWLRNQLEAQYAAFGAGAPPWSERFDYRSTERDFSVWGWRFQVANRPTTEFLQLTDVTCHGLTLRGSGTVTITPPSSCNVNPVTVDLGPSGAIDPPAGSDALPIYGTSKHVTLH